MLRRTRSVVVALACALTLTGGAYALASDTHTHARFTRSCIAEDDYAHVALVAFTRDDDGVHVRYRCTTH